MHTDNPSCDSIICLLPDYISRRLSPATQESVRRHLSVCPACARAFEAEHDLTLIARGGDVPPPPQLLTAVMVQVRAEPRAIPPFRIRPVDVTIALATTAAFVGLFAGFAALQVVLPFLNLPLAVVGWGDEAFWTTILGMSLPGVTIVGIALVVMHRTHARGVWE